MAQPFQKFPDFLLQLGKKLHNLDTDTLKVYLSDELPLSTDTVKADIAEIAAGNGYNSGGEDTLNTYSILAGVCSCVGVDITWNASGPIGPFRYAILYNDTAASKNLVGYWDYGSSISLVSPQYFKTDFGSSMFTVGP